MKTFVLPDTIAPDSKQYHHINAIDLMRWAAPIMGIEDYHTIWDVILAECGNDGSYRLWMGDYEDFGGDDIANRFAQLVMEVYGLNPTDQVYLDLSW